MNEFGGRIEFGPKQVIKMISFGVCLLLVLSVVSCSWYTIDQTERGVLLRNGAVTSLSEPGLHFKVPFIDTIATINIETHLIHWGENTAMGGYSRDQQPAVLAVSVNYRVIDPLRLYGEYRDREGAVARIIVPRANEQVRNVFGRFNAVEAVQQRARFNLEVEDAIKEAVNTDNGVVYVESVQVENIDFSDAYEASVEQRMLAEVEVQRLQQNAERERVQAEIVVIQATAAAEQVRLAGEATAAAINARGQALRDNPQLVDLVAAEKWNGVLPTTMIPGSAVPFLNIGN